MNTPLQGTLTPVSRLRTALEDTALALATADLDRLLAADTALQAALHELPYMSAVHPDERLLFRRELEGAAAARAASRGRAASRVRSSGAVPLGRVALILPDFT